MSQFMLAEDVAHALPHMRVVVVMVSRINNASANPGVQSFSDGVIQTFLQENGDLPNVQSHPRIAHYRTTLKALNIAPKKFPQSNESLYKRILKLKGPLRPINPIVDFYNAISIQYGVTAGAFDIQDLDNEPVELRFSREDDTFLALDADESAKAVFIPPKELSYCVGNTVLTRQLAWRQSLKGLIKDETTDVMLMSEILDENGSKLAEAVRKDMVDGLKQHFGVDAESVILGFGVGKLVL
ncbi:B3/B4 tRNA-binding domain-containing protein [Polychaeton citri CBS 116435]|uniref:B3/B4 tRNA-binding domain-containing protein n=1 Tax=Polychaeton citri CBS 116435 TaxID=1314669 RepID=A0A9P4UME3_9PEZI|nr:B3/B4 tRNA-binding domain-containing protein [Polychaeton citri CBS 116435]